MTHNQLFKKICKVNFLLIFIACNNVTQNNSLLCGDLKLMDNVYLINDVEYNGVCNVIDTDIVITEKFIKSGKVYSEKGYYFPSGNIKYEGKIVNDSLNGKYYQYFENGQLRVKGKFYRGFPDGRWYKYDNQGKRLSVQIFKKGELIKTRF